LGEGNGSLLFTLTTPVDIADVLFHFEHLVQKGLNIRKIDNGDDLWEALKAVDNYGKIP
jgi:hypothetical protein